MFEKVLPAIRRATGNRFTPLISLLLATATFVLTLLVVLPGTKSGRLENFHLLTLNTSNAGQQAIQFTPATSDSTSSVPAVQAKSQWQNNTNTAPSTNGTASQNSSSTSNSTLSTNHTTTVTVSTPASTQCPIPDTETLVGELVQDVLTNLEAGNIGIVGNITTALKNELQKSEGELGQILGALLQNATQSLGNSSGSAGSFFQSVIQGVFSDMSGFTSANTTGGFSGFIKQILGKFSQSIATGLTKAQGEAAQGITEALGIQQFYSLHLREVCAGNLSSPSDPKAVFTITGCLSYSDATSGFAHLVSNIPTSTTVLSTNISIPAILQVQEVGIYLASLFTTLDKTIFAFYAITLICSMAVIIGSISACVLPSTPAFMYSNLGFSIIGALTSLAGSATVTAFMTTANSIVNLLGSSLGLRAGLGSNFLIAIWISCGLAIATNLYVLAVWFFQFRTISVKVQRRSPQDMSAWTGLGSVAMVKAGARPGVSNETSEETVVSARGVKRGTMRNSRSGRRNSKYEDF